MVLFNYSTKELTAKIVYYGPGLCGKTTNLQYIFDNLPSNIHKGKMLSLATKTDRTLFFDFLPIDLGTIRGMRTRLQLYTVPGQVFYNTTRKLVLKGADGLVFVADSQSKMVDANRESFGNMKQNLAEHGLDLSTIPHVLQFNKRDIGDILSVEDLNSALNEYNVPIYEAVATTGIGVQDTLKAVTRLVLNSLREKYSDGKRAAAAPAAARATATIPATRPASASPEIPATRRTAPPAVAEAEPVLELAEEEEEAAAIEVAEPVLSMAEPVAESVIEEESPVLQMDQEEPEPVAVLEMADEPQAEPAMEASVPLALELPGEPADESPSLDAMAAEEVSVSGPLPAIEDEEEEPVTIEETGESESFEFAPSPLAESPAPPEPVADGATVAIGISPTGPASPSSGHEGPGASQERSFPLALEVDGQTVHLKVTITVRVEKT